MKYRIFERSWWRDAACTIPDPGRKRGRRIVNSEAEAREICRRENSERPGHYRRTTEGKEFVSNRGPYGNASEYEAIG